MFWGEAIGFLLTVSGMIALIVGLRFAIILIRMKTALTAQWRLLSVFLSFFIVGYFLFLIHIVVAGYSLQMLLTSSIFFGGGIFVFLVMGLFVRTIQQVEATQKLALLNKELQYLADRDELTGAYKRRYFENAVQKALTLIKDGADKRFIVLYIDVNNFKTLNDTYGHLVGDDVLKVLCKAFQEKFRGDDVIARFGGDEFVILLEVGLNQDIEQLATLFVERINHLEVVCNGEAVTPAISVGVAFITDHCQTVEAILASADQACYVAKQKKAKGGSHFVIAPRH